MSAFNVLVRKFRSAVSGSPPLVEPAPRLFNWETFPAQPAGASPSIPVSGSVAALPSSPPRAITPERASSVVGSAIPADVEDFDTVYRGAGVTEPEHGYGVDLVGQMLDHSSLAQLDRPVKAKAVLAALDAAGVAIQDVIHDAVLRFRALIAFEAAKELETSDIGPRNQARIEHLEREIEAFRAEKSAEIAERVRETSAAKQTLERLRMRARAEQDRYSRAVSLFVESLPAEAIPMTPPAAEAIPVTPAPEAATPSPELKLVTAGAPSEVNTPPEAIDEGRADEEAVVAMDVEARPAPAAAAAAAKARGQAARK